MKNKQKLSIKKGDVVKVIAGDQKGLMGNILSINYKKLTAILSTTKLRKKFSKKTQESKEKQIPIAIHISNLMMWDQEKELVSRIGFKLINGKKERYFKKSGNILLEKTNT